MKMLMQVEKRRMILLADKRLGIAGFRRVGARASALPAASVVLTTRRVRTTIRCAAFRRAVGVETHIAYWTGTKARLPAPVVVTAAFHGAVRRAAPRHAEPAGEAGALVVRVGARAAADEPAAGVVAAELPDAVQLADGARLVGGALLPEHALPAQAAAPVVAAVLPVAVRAAGVRAGAVVAERRIGLACAVVDTLPARPALPVRPARLPRAAGGARVFARPRITDASVGVVSRITDRCGAITTNGEGYQKDT